LEEGFAELAYLFAAKKGFFSWQYVLYEGFVRLLSLLVGEITEKKVIV
jgi:hypothetical protein